MNERIKKHRAVSESLHAAVQLPFISLSAGASACNYHTHSRRQLDYFWVLQFRPRRLCEECWRGAAEEKRNNARPNLEHARIAENRILEIIRRLLKRNLTLLWTNAAVSLHRMLGCVRFLCWIVALVWRCFTRLQVSSDCEMSFDGWPRNVGKFISGSAEFCMITPLYGHLYKG